MQNVSKWYGEFQVLTDCTTKVEKGEVIVVCGPSGSGKSTLMSTLWLEQDIFEGDIVVDGTKINDPKTDLPKLRQFVVLRARMLLRLHHLLGTQNLTLGQVKVL